MRTRNAFDNVRVNNAFSSWNIVYFDGENGYNTRKNDINFLDKNPILKGNMINRILQLWSFHMEFMKLDEASFH